MLKPPCERRCEDRHVGCHGTCEKYHEYAVIVGDARDRRNKYKEKHPFSVLLLANI